MSILENVKSIYWGRVCGVLAGSVLLGHGIDCGLWVIAIPGLALALVSFAFEF